MKALDRAIDRFDRWQRHNRIVAPAYAVNKKFGDDQANFLVVGLGWYGFTAIYPLLLVVVTIFGFIGAASLGHGIVTTLHQFPVIGSEFQHTPTGSSRLHGNVAGLVIGLVLLVYGAQGVTQTAQQAMATVWGIPKEERPGFLPRLGRSIGALVIIGGCFLVNAALGVLATGGDRSYAVRVPVIAAMVVINVVSYAAAFRALTPKAIGTRSLVPGAVAAAIGFTALITLGSGLVAHLIRNSSETYGQFAVVIGLVGFLLILAKLSIYAAELNVVLDRHLWPRSMREDKNADVPPEPVGHDPELADAPTGTTPPRP
ncbi:MAG TPA: YhjD/YihY/BrkB family envelope integrity protein [Acidimicrobiales bacterium]|nr:YhjD/YihY/BrkB family envelope integrity protein [Acidimicrobiales bacterium]